MLKKKIRCHHCGKFFKKKMERKKEVYICGGYANYGKDFCQYAPLAKEKLDYLISQHFQKRIEEVDYDQVEIILAQPPQFTIYYLDGSTSIYDPSLNLGTKIKF